MLNQNNLKIAALALNPKSDHSRKPLTCLLVEKDKTTATNGAALIQVSKPALDPTEFPEIPDRAVEEVTRSYLITADQARDIEKSLKANNKNNYSILKFASELANGDGGDDDTVKITTTDLDTFNTRTLRPIREQYPDVEKVMPIGEPVLTVAFNAQLLAKVMDLVAKLKGASKDVCAPVKLHFYSNKTAVKFEATTFDELNSEQKISGLIMPIRVDEDSI